MITEVPTALIGPCGGPLVLQHLAGVGFVRESPRSCWRLK